MARWRGLDFKLAWAFPETLKPIRAPQTCEPRRYLNSLLNNGPDGEPHFKLTKLALVGTFYSLPLTLLHAINEIWWCRFEKTRGYVFIPLHWRGWGGYGGGDQGMNKHSVFNSIQFAQAQSYKGAVVLICSSVWVWDLPLLFLNSFHLIQVSHAERSDLTK